MAKSFKTRFECKFFSFHINYHLMIGPPIWFDSGSGRPEMATNERFLGRIGTIVVALDGFDYNQHRCLRMTFSARSRGRVCTLASGRMGAWAHGLYHVPKAKTNEVGFAKKGENYRRAYKLI